MLQPRVDCQHYCLPSAPHPGVQSFLSEYFFQSFGVGKGGKKSKRFYFVSVKLLVLMTLANEFHGEGHPMGRDQAARRTRQSSSLSSSEVSLQPWAAQVCLAPRCSAQVLLVAGSHLFQPVPHYIARPLGTLVGHPQEKSLHLPGSDLSVGA